MTTTPRYRIGNDMTILWAINNKDGSPFDLSGKDVRLFMTHRYGREEVECSVVTLPDGSVNNVIRWSFSGDDQKVLGVYALTASIYTSEDLKLVKKDICEAFELVGTSCLECEEGGDAIINDGGDLILSSKLDIYRFGIPKIHIGPDGYWYIDNVNTGVSALGGDPGMVRHIYQIEQLYDTFAQESKIDTFNAYAISSLANRIKHLESDDYLQLKNMTDVLMRGELTEGQQLVWDGTRWTNRTITTKSSSGDIPGDLEKRLIALEQLLKWFSFDSDSGQIKANYGLYTFGGLTAGGKGQLGSMLLSDLSNVNITSPVNGQSLVYDSAVGKWVNKVVSGGGTGGGDISGHTSDLNNPHRVTKGQIGLSEVENISLSTWTGNANISTVGTITSGEWKGSTIANQYLANNSMSIAGNNVVLGGSLAADILKRSLAISFDDLASHPTTIEGYGITDAYTKELADKTFVKIGDDIRIGEAKISWDAEAGMLKVDKGFYSLGAITAGGKGASNKYRLDSWSEWTTDEDGVVTDPKLLESSLSAKLGVELYTKLNTMSASLGPVTIDLAYIKDASSLTADQAAAVGLTEEVISNLIAGKYTKVVFVSSGMSEVWSYSGYADNNHTSLFFTQGDGADTRNGISMHRDNDGNWQIA